MKLENAATRVRNKIIYLLRLEQRLRHWEDERFLKLQWRLHMGGRLDLENPQTFGEKIQWLKIHDRKSVYTSLVDKYEVKKWVAGKIGESYVVPTLGVWNTFAEIDFDSLPEQFVLKCTHDSGGLAICTDRSAFNFKTAREKINRSLARNYHYLGREWPYKDVKPRVLAEVYLPSWVPKNAATHGATVYSPSLSQDTNPPTTVTEVADIIDYKFYCFHGEPKFLYVSQGLSDHATAKMDFLTLDWDLTGFTRPDYLRFDELPAKPACFNEMVKVARELSAGIPFVRVDLFEHFGSVLFSEMTFHPVSGMMKFNPPQADVQIGKLLDLDHVSTTGKPPSE